MNDIIIRLDIWWNNFDASVGDEVKLEYSTYFETVANSVHLNEIN